MRDEYSIGPWKAVVGMLFASEGRRYYVLECGHAAQHEGTYQPKRKSCSICCDQPVQDYRLKRCVEDVEAAKLEGKRRRLVAHFKAKGEEPPPQALKCRSVVALYENAEDVIEEW